MEKITLKKFLNTKNKWVFCLIMTGIFLAFYTACGALGAQYGSQLPLLPYEESIPFIKDSVIIYIVLYPIYLIWVLLELKDETQMNRMFYAFIFINLVSFIAFSAFPTIYPRYRFILPPDNDLTTLIFRGLHKVDAPSNCLPSLHVALVFLFAQTMKGRGWKYVVSIFISILISISTLTTKQHYVYDIVAGATLSLACWYFIEKYVVFSLPKRK